MCNFGAAWSENPSANYIKRATHKFRNNEMDKVKHALEPVPFPLFGRGKKRWIQEHL